MFRECVQHVQNSKKKKKKRLKKSDLSIVYRNEENLKPCICR